MIYWKTAGKSYGRFPAVVRPLFSQNIVKTLLYLTTAYFYAGGSSGTGFYFGFRFHQYMYMYMYMYVYVCICMHMYVYVYVCVCVCVCVCVWIYILQDERSRDEATLPIVQESYCLADPQHAFFMAMLGGRGEIMDEGGTLHA